MLSPKLCQGFEELESIQRQVPTRWRQLQTNNRDSESSFIYRSQSLREVVEACRIRRFSPDQEAYAIHRWKNLYRHDLWIEVILECAPASRRFENPRDRTRDIYLSVHSVEVPFDVKVTRWPQRLDPSSTPYEVAMWLYGNQSREGRFHLENRFYVVGRPEDRVSNLEASSKAAQKIRNGVEPLELKFPHSDGGAKAVVVVVE